MNEAKALEYRIIQQLLRRRERQRSRSAVDRLIVCLTIATCILMVSLYLPELLWVVLAGALILSLGVR
ncbi:MAG: hypothetical protein HOC23_18235 [Halieaceae bacterium]|jgi:hypothetical protein|nr:hypothetical protein [Halieaceae bacterium]